MIRAYLFLPLLLGSAACDARTGTCAGKSRNVVAAGFQPQPRPLPTLTGRVVDQANILPPQAEGRLGARLAALESSTRDQLVVVTVPSLEGEPIEKLGLRLGRGWGIGQKDLDNGVLLIVAPNERRVRIEVGYGLEGLLTDERAAQILKEQVLPKFADSEMEGGISEGVGAIVATLESDRIRPRCREKAAA